MILESYLLLGMDILLDLHKYAFCQDKTQAPLNARQAKITKSVSFMI